jgi:hypothetical protein
MGRLEKRTHERFMGMGLQQLHGTVKCRAQVHSSKIIVKPRAGGLDARFERGF